MTVEETVVGSLVGVVGGFLLGLYTQNWNMKRSTRESNKGRGYSPLFDEIEDVLEKLSQNDPPWSLVEWPKIKDQQHLSYLIEPSALYDKVRNFYDQTLSNLVQQIIGSRKVYEEFVRQDLTAKIESASASSVTGEALTIPAIKEVASGVGWNLFKGSVWIGDLPNLNHNYDILKRGSCELKGAFQEYFDFWVARSKDDKVLVDYRRMRDNATEEAKILRKDLAKTLGMRLK